MNKKHLLSLFLSLLICGCESTTPIELSSGYPYYPLSRNNTHCLFYVDEIKDQRPDQSSVGSVYGWGNQKLGNNSNDLKEWIRENLIQSQSNITEKNPQIHIKVSIRQAYIHPRTNSLNATVLLRVDYRLNQKLLKAATYRGHVSKMNWLGSSIECLSALNEALAQIVFNVHNDLAALCQTSSSDHHENHQ